MGIRAHFIFFNFFCRLWMCECVRLSWGSGRRLLQTRRRRIRVWTHTGIIYSCYHQLFFFTHVQTAVGLLVRLRQFIFNFIFIFAFFLLVFCFQARADCGGAAGSAAGKLLQKKKYPLLGFIQKIKQGADSGEFCVYSNSKSRRTYF
jgi:hypothetical protein